MNNLTKIASLPQGGGCKAALVGEVQSNGSPAIPPSDWDFRIVASVPSAIGTRFSGAGAEYEVTACEQIGPDKWLISYVAVTLTWLPLLTPGF